MQHITPCQLRDRLQRAPAPLLLDVREPHEFQLCHLEGSRHIPLRELPGRLGELNADEETVVICHHGMRSQQGAALLEQHGFKQVLNLRGGLHAWANEVDPTMPRY